MPKPIPRTRSALAPLLAARGLRATRRLGQNFLVDPALADALVDDAGVTQGDLVVEVGPGAGGLTQPLLARAGHVVAVEIDSGLHALLAEHLGDDPRLSLVHADALDGPDGLAPAITSALDDPEARGCRRALVVANLPYSCGTPLVAALLRRTPAPARIVAMLQSEVVARMCAAPGSADYGPLAVLATLRAEVAVVRRVPPHVFLPRPEVESSVFRVVPRPGDARAAAAASDLAARAFRMRRKRLLRALDGAADAAALAAAGIDATLRPEDVPPEAWLRLAGEVAARGSA